MQKKNVHFLMHERWFLIDPRCVSTYPLSGRFLGSEENLEILNLKNSKNKLSGIASDLWQLATRQASVGAKTKL